MYPRNAANPERIAIGCVVQISDGVVQSSGVTVSVHPQGGTETTGGGTIAYNTSNQVLYTPTQAETNYTSFIVTAYKTGCFPISQTVVTTATNIPGEVVSSKMQGSGFSANTDTLEKIRDRLDAVGASASSPAADKAYTLTWTRTVGDDDGGSSSDTITVNGTSFVTGETTGTTLLEVDGTVTVDDPLETPRAIQLWAEYTGGSPHALIVKAYNYVDSTWEPIGTITLTSGITPWIFYLNPQHINTSSGQIQIKIIHNTASGNPLHALSIDKGLLLASSAIPAFTVDAFWDEVISPSNHNVKNSAAYKLWRQSESLIYTGLAVSGTANTITLAEGDSSEFDGAYDPAIIAIVAGTGVGQSRLILQYKGHPDHIAVIDRDWKIVPDATSEVIISANPGREHVNEGQAQGITPATDNTIILNANASSVDNAYKGQNIFLRSGTGQDQARRVLSYNGTTKELIVTRAWGVVPDTTTGYVMLPTGAISDDCLRNAVWKALKSDYATTPGTMGEDQLAPTIAIAVRDVDNTNPPSGSLGHAIQTGATFYAADFISLSRTVWPAPDPAHPPVELTFTPPLVQGEDVTVYAINVRDNDFETLGYYMDIGNWPPIGWDDGHFSGTVPLSYCLDIASNFTQPHAIHIKINTGDAAGFELDVNYPTGSRDALVKNDGTIVMWTGTAINRGTSGGGGGELDEYFQTTLNRLLEQKVEGSIVTVAPSPIDPITLYQNNDYPEFELTLGPQWSPYLDGTYFPYLTIKEKIVDGAVLSEVVGTVIDQGQGTLSFPLTKAHTNLAPTKYMWQVQLRLPDIDPDLPPVSVKVAASGTLHIRPTLKSVGISATEEPATLAPMITVTTAYTILSTDYYILADGTFAITLPDAIGLAGKLFRIKNIGTGVITIEPVLGQTIDGQINKSLMNQYDAIKLVSDGANWSLF